MAFLNFFATRNMLDPQLVECAPWDFAVEKTELEALRGKAKPARKALLQQETTNWNLYSAVRGINRNARVSKDNPPVAIRGLVADYDMKSTLESVESLVNQLSPQFQPNFYELSLSKKARLVWVFEREILVPSSEFATEVYRAFCRKIKIPTILPGFDQSSEKPAQIWTNGGEWYNLRENPLSWEICFGILCDVSKKGGLFEKSEVPVETVAKEVAKRWPRKWQGDFKLDAIGVRFWDDKADNPTGCQVKPDGMLCFTGNTPFMKWSEIFGIEWCDEQRVLSLGKAANDIYFDGKQYWEKGAGGQWKNKSRADAILTLQNRGLNDKAQKGQTVSDAGRVLYFIQQENRVDGAAPLINYKPGIVEVGPRKILNVTTMQPFEPIKRDVSNEECEKLWLKQFLNGHFARPEGRPEDFFLSWLRRSYQSMYEYRRWMGQAVFLCGPADNGKTLLCLRIVAPLLGGRVANPFDYFTGDTNFNDDLFEAGLWAINDEESPRNEGVRQKFLSRVKASVVNPSHTYHPKFCSRISIDWTGRVFSTLNNDPASVGLLPEVCDNTQDKMHFFASREYSGVWDESHIIEERLEKELPLFARWLLSTYTPPRDILIPSRMGMKSYFDPVILDLSRQQVHAYNLIELLAVWVKLESYWTAEVKEWLGTPTDLLAQFSANDILAPLLRDWNVQKIAKSLTTLAKLKDSGVEFSDSTNERTFKLIREKLIK